jgi:hypothetical protein
VSRLGIALVLALALVGGARADAPPAEPAPPKPAAPTAPANPPRWRLRAEVVSGFGGSRDSGDTIAMFPTTIELGLRLWGPVSLDAGATATLAGEGYQACGSFRRPNAITGTAGLRVDFANGKASSWLDPFLEVHGGVGGQGRGREVNGVCSPGGVFGTGGGRVGLDVWLGKTAVTVVASFDYLPIGSPISIAIGASFVLK